MWRVGWDWRNGYGVGRVRPRWVRAEAYRVVMSNWYIGFSGSFSECLGKGNFKGAISWLFHYGFLKFIRDWWCRRRGYKVGV